LIAPTTSAELLIVDVDADERKPLSSVIPPRSLALPLNPGVDFFLYGTLKVNKPKPLLDDMFLALPTSDPSAVDTCILHLILVAHQGLCSFDLS